MLPATRRREMAVPHVAVAVAEGEKGFVMTSWIPRWHRPISGEYASLPLDG